MKSDFYKTGLPFNGKISNEINHLKKRIELNKASMLIVDGGIGEGKTTLAVHVAENYQGAPLDFKKQIGMGGEEFQKRLNTCIKESLPVCIYDEAGDFSRRGWASKLNKEMNRVFDIFRTFRILIIVVLPMFSELDANLFKKSVPQLLLHCHGRTKNQGKIKVYNLYRMSYLLSKIQHPRLIYKKDAYKIVKPNSLAQFKNLTKEREAQLDRVSTSGKRHILNAQEINNAGLLTYKQIGEELGKAPTTIRDMILKKKIKETKVYEKRKYFDKSVLTKL